MWYGCDSSISFICIILPSVFFLVSVGLDYCPYHPPEIGLCAHDCDLLHHLSMAAAAAAAHLDHWCYRRLLVATTITLALGSVEVDSSPSFFR